MICGSYMFEFSVSKDMKKKISIFSNTNYQGIEH